MKYGKSNEHDQVMVATTSGTGLLMNYYYVISAGPAKSLTRQRFRTKGAGKLVVYLYILDQPHVLTLVVIVTTSLLMHCNIHKN